jgi:hypothetical protein
MRRKGEASGLMNERDFPHLVELPLPPDGFRNVSSEFDAFHRERGIPLRRGRGRREAEHIYRRFCFPSVAHADAFCDRFGGKRLTYSSSQSKRQRHFPDPSRGAQQPPHSP